MKKEFRVFIGVIVTLVLLVGIFVRYILSDSIIEFLPGKIDSVSFYDSTLQDYTEFKKYTFKDSEKLRKKLDNHKYLKHVKTEDIDYLAGIFQDFEGWIDDYKIYSEYDIDASNIDEEDYFYVEDADIKENDDGRIVYFSYDLYYFDTQSVQGYFLHNNI